MQSDIRAALVAEARSWVGTPWRPFGRKKGEAADCIFLEEVARVVTGFKGRHSGYSMMPKDRQLERYADKELIVVTSRDPDLRAPSGISEDYLRPGDLALFRGRNLGEPQHFGMIADHPAVDGVKTLIHAAGNQQHGRVVEHSISNSQQWMRRLWKIYRIPGA